MSKQPMIIEYILMTSHYQTTTCIWLVWLNRSLNAQYIYIFFLNIDSLSRKWMSAHVCVCILMFLCILVYFCLFVFNSRTYSTSVAYIQNEAINMWFYTIFSKKKRLELSPQTVYTYTYYRQECQEEWEYINSNGQQITKIYQHRMWDITKDTTINLRPFFTRLIEVLESIQLLTSLSNPDVITVQ